MQCHGPAGTPLQPSRLAVAIRGGLQSAAALLQKIEKFSIFFPLSLSNFFANFIAAFNHFIHKFLDQPRMVLMPVSKCLRC